jgi:ferric-dicitrate binding protein FerR (iron transport regulator)
MLICLPARKFEINTIDSRLPPCQRIHTAAHGGHPKHPAGSMMNIYRWPLAFVFLFAPLASSRAQPLSTEGNLSYFAGSVEVMRSGARENPEIGMPLFSGDVVKTGPGSTAVLSLEDGAEIKLRENTAIEVNAAGRDVEVKLSSGSIFSKIIGKLRGKYTVRTETVLAGVRGTEFFVAYGKTIDRYADVWLCVASGSVDVSIIGTRESAVIKEGKGVNIVGGTKLTKPRRYKWTQRLNWNMDPVKGSVEDRTDLEQAYGDLLDQDYE